MAAVLAGVVAVVIAIAVGVSDSGPDMDKRSYEKGYDAFGGAALPSSGDDRDADEASCEELWGSFPTDELAGVVKDDWVTGCADAREGKASQF
ncbi:hypothetical protein [Streptomyces sp. NPDC001089]